MFAIIKLVYLLIDQIQDKLPLDSTLLGTIISSDKTTISAMTGDRVAHPLLISLVNFIMDFRLKALFHVFLLLALIPVPKFIYKVKSIRGVLENRLIHECFDFVLNSLKIATCIGAMMSDPLGSLHRCHTPLVSCIIDIPESTMLSGVTGKTSSITMASYKQFGDLFQHEPRTASTTLAQTAALLEQYDPWDDLEAFVKAARKIGQQSKYLNYNVPCKIQWCTL